MTKVEKFAGMVLIVVVALTFIFWKDITRSGSNAGLAQVKAVKGESKNKKDKADKKENQKTDPKITIAERWKMPDILREISGIAHINGDIFACVQDEEGKIFVFNMSTKKIENEIQFGDAGDYEGIALVNETAWIVRADGRLFEVKNFKQKPTLQQHTTHLTEKQNIEGLCYDKANNRLLLAIKGKEPNTDDYKGIYAFDLVTKKLAATPVIKIDLTDKVWAEVKGKNKIQPSDLEVHPKTGDIFIVDGSNPKLLVLGQDGKRKELYKLSDSEFRQPEGISITENGEIFISNEGQTGSGDILKIVIDEETT